MDRNKPVRIVLKFKVQNIPGDPPSRRANVLVDAFTQQHFQREFRFGHDWMHVPCNIDFPRGSAILILDLNAKSGPTVNADNVPLRCSLAAPGPNTADVQDAQAPEKQKEILYILFPMLRAPFSHLHRHFQATQLFDVRHYSSMFPWGGRGHCKFSPSMVYAVECPKYLTG